MAALSPIKSWVYQNVFNSNLCPFVKFKLHIFFKKTQETFI